MLGAEHDALEEELGQHGEKKGGAWQGSSTDVAIGEEADSTDAADNIEELIVNVPLVEDLGTRMKEVDAAIKSIDAGTYGICQVCHAEIPSDRLMANPAATTCVAHAA